MARHAASPEGFVVLETITFTVSSPSMLMSVAWISAELAEVESGRETPPPNSSLNELQGRANGGIVGEGIS